MPALRRQFCDEQEVALGHVYVNYECLPSELSSKLSLCKRCAIDAWSFICSCQFTQQQCLCMFPWRLRFFRNLFAQQLMFALFCNRFSLCPSISAHESTCLQAWARLCVFEYSPFLMCSFIKGYKIQTIHAGRVKTAACAMCVILERSLRQIRGAYFLIGG